ncbi:hypothetical protein M5K25_003020 [Dendrobium thyrsiflorum]|uniref:Cysteine-rich transmembrane domain-containing protein n=1 Tax=Dendrobium thyrsiflorum TaxID=117978 RepID=A0ABD0VP08_DENTH
MEEIKRTRRGMERREIEMRLRRRCDWERKRFEALESVTATCLMKCLNQSHTGYYQGPPVMAPPLYSAAPPPRKETGFLEGCLAALCCCFLLDECCCDPSVIFVT